MIPQKEDIHKILKSIRENSDYNLNNYSMNSIGRRLSKILNDLKLSPEKLISNMHNDSVYIEDIIKRITVNTTELFRDPVIWVNLRDIISTQFKDQKELKIWHPGCSTGQEVYSMMIMLDDMGWLGKTKIYASDINRDVVNVSMNGEYKLRFHSEYLKNFDKTLNPVNRRKKINYEKYIDIDTEKDMMKMKEFLVKKPVYKIIDLVKDENLFKESFDIIICRNVIIYFNYDLQNRVLNLFYNNMKKKSFLLLGLHESIIGTYASRFNKKEGVYFKNNL